MFSNLSRLTTSPVESFHKITTCPRQPDASSWPLGLKATEVTLLRRPLKVRTSRPSSKSQSLTFASSPPEASQHPFRPEVGPGVGPEVGLKAGLMASEETPFVWPVNVRIASPDETFHILMVLSQLPETIARPSGVNTTAVTCIVWPSKVCASRPVTTRQILIVLSWLAETSHWPSGLKATALTSALCPRRT